MATVAFLLERMDEDAPVSPFFAKARWLMCFDPSEGKATWMLNHPGDVRWLRQQICAGQPDMLVCGWIDDASLRTLRYAGIDVRLGPSTVSALSLLSRLHELPRPRPELRSVD